MKTKKIKILYINGSFKNDSGCAVIADETARLFKENNYEVEIFTTKDKFYGDAKYSKYFPEHFNTVKKYLLNQWRYYYNWTAQANIQKVINDFEPDIVHVHSLRISSLTYSVLKPIINRKIPIVMTLHDCFQICPMMALTTNNNTLCKDVKCKKNKIHCLLNNCANNYEQSFRYMMMSIVNKITGYDKFVSKFISPSDALKNILINNCDFLNEDNVTTIYNFIPNKYEFSDINTLKEKNKYFLYVGRLSKEKGVINILKAALKLPKNIEFRIAGNGPYEKVLKKYVEDNNLNNIMFLGHLNKQQLQNVYKECISIITPSVCYESFGLTNIEAAINCKPTISSNAGALPEVVNINETGLIYQYDNMEELRKCILLYWNNPNLASQHGKNAYNNVKNIYTCDNYFKKLKQVYDEVLKNEK